MNETFDRGVAWSFVVSSFAGDGISHNICRIAVRWELETNAFHMRLHFHLGTAVDHASLAEKDEGVEGLEVFLAGLMDNCYDGHT